MECRSTHRAGSSTPPEQDHRTATTTFKKRLLRVLEQEEVAARVPRHLEELEEVRREEEVGRGEEGGRGEEEDSPTYQSGCVHRASICLGSPLIMERFRKSHRSPPSSSSSSSTFSATFTSSSIRSKTRPSTFSTFSVVGASSHPEGPRSPRFYTKLARWFHRKRGKRLASDTAAFPTEKHSSTLHCAKEAPPPRAPLLSTTSTASQCSVLPLPPRHALSQESGYHSSSTSSSPGSSLRHRTSPFAKTRRFRFKGRTFRAGHASLSEDIPESEAEVGGGAAGWYSQDSRSQDDSLAEGRRAGFHRRPQVFAGPAVEMESRPPSAADSLAASSSVFGGSSGSQSSLQHSDAHESVAVTLGDFRIKHSELEFGRVVVGRTTPHCRIQQGRWHGGVLIHSCSPQDDADVEAWLAEVRVLAQIRQENLVLYMGACVEPPVFAIITSPLKAESLHMTTMVQGRRLSAPAKLALLRQTADALSYLHGRGIAHGRLSAHNIFLESKVKVSMLDYAPNSLNLEYYGPEVACRLDSLLPCRPPCRSPEADVFAFGTLVFQVATDRQPLAALPAQARLWLAATGHLPSLLAAQPAAVAGSSLGRLAARCWRAAPAERPTFTALCTLLQPARCLDKKLSLSEPRNLSQLGKPGGSGLLS